MKPPTCLSPLPLRTRTSPVRMLRSHSPSRAQVSTPVCQPEAATAGGRDNGGGGRRHLGRQTRPPPQARARGPQSPGAPAGLYRSRNRSEHKAPAGQRAALARPRSYPPQPGGAAGGPCRRRQQRRPAPRRASDPVRRQQPGRRAGAVVRHNYAGPGAALQKFGALLTYPPWRPVPPRPPAPGCPPALGQPSRDAQTAGPRCSTCLGGSSGLGRTLSLTRPPEGPPGQGTTALPRQRPTETGGDAGPLPSGGARPQPGRGRGAPRPQHPRKAGEEVMARPEPAPGLPALSQASRPIPAGACRSQPSGPPARERLEEGARRCSPRSRPGLPPSRPLAHLPAVFAVAVPTAAPSLSSSPGVARAGAGLPKDWAQAPELLLELGAEETCSPPRRSAEAEGGRCCGAQRRLAAGASPLASAFLTVPHARKGGTRARRGAH